MFTNWWHYYTPIMNYQKEKLKRQSHLLLKQENKFKQEGKRPILEKL